ncbi:retroviral-like aspartic protease family protein [Sphingomonas sp. 1P06PA]|uniref:retroviral-like aspartic protease family protein n=1 Tax=Sphingomonas sp. 1P06PA TaxID=554121 RepID=UPI0039A68271
MSLTAFAAALLTVPAPPAIATAPSLATPAAVTPIGDEAEDLLTGRDRVQRMTVPVLVNGAGPYPFVVDTGADRSVVSRRLQAELALPHDGAVTLHGITGAETIQTARVARMGVGKREIADVRAPVLSEGNLGARGMLGIDAINDQRVTMDFKANRMTIAPAPRREQRDSDEIVVTARRRFGQLILADMRIDGRKVYAIIDSGAENSIGNTELMTLLENKRIGRPLSVTLTSVTGATTVASLRKVPKIVIGGVTLVNIPIAFADIHTFRQFGIGDKPAMLIGMDVLRIFERVSLDFRQKRVRFRLRDDEGASAVQQLAGL